MQPSGAHMTALGARGCGSGRQPWQMAASSPEGSENLLPRGCCSQRMGRWDCWSREARGMWAFWAVVGTGLFSEVAGEDGGQRVGSCSVYL